MDENLLTPAEVAERLQVVVSTVTRWIDDGRLKAITLPSGRKRVRESEVTRILMSGDHGGE